MRLEECGDGKTELEASADLCSFSCKSKDSSIVGAMHLEERGTELIRGMDEGKNWCMTC